MIKAIFPTPVLFNPSTEERLSNFIALRSDWAVYHWDDGVPWVEAAASTLYHNNLELTISKRRAARNRRFYSKPHFLSLSPLSQTRSGLAEYWGAKDSLPLPSPWNSRSFSDTTVQSTYLAHCVRMIREFEPVVVCYSAEANMLLEKAPNLWSEYLSFCNFVYSGLKAEFPSLPTILSFQLGSIDRNQTLQLSEIAKLLPVSDWIGISAYPFLDGYLDPRNIPTDWISRLLTLAPEKPWGILETCYPAATIPVGVGFIPGTEERQARYLQRIVQECTTRAAQCLIWSMPMDYVRQWNPTLPEFAGVWRTCGLVDDDFTERWALRVWERI